MKLLLPLILASTLAAQSPTVSFPSTGAKSTAGNPNQDANWTVFSSTLAGEASSGAAAIVTNLPAGWAKPAAGSNWISVQPDQSNATRPGTCCQGESQYQVTFNVDDPTKAVMQFTVAGDEDMDIYLNGFDTNRIIYSTTGPTADRPDTVTRTQGQVYQDPGGYSHVVQFNKGLNTILVVLGNNGGGPTGVYISTTPAGGGGGGGGGGTTSTSYTDASVSDNGANAMPDPIDSASGQFFATETDFFLGGPMGLGFQRYYSSQLSKSGFTPSLGTNWMSTYEVSALVNGTKAQVLLFKGRVVTFNNSAGAWQLVSPQKWQYQFLTVSGGGGYRFLDPTENRIYTFSTAGALTKIENRNGNAITVTPGATGPAKVSDGMGRTLTFGYTNGQLASVTDQSGRIETFTYSAGMLSTVTDPLKAVTNYAYTTVGTITGLLTKETLPLGNAPVSQTYDANGRALTQTDASNNTTKIVYDGRGGTVITNPSGDVVRHLSDASSGNIDQISDSLGGTAQIAYDPLKQPISIQKKAGGILQYSYDPKSGQIASVIDANNNTTSFSYTPQTVNGLTYYSQTGIAYPDGTTTSRTYDTNGNLLSATAPDQSTTSFNYDNQGRVMQISSSGGPSLALNWNADGTLASETDALGNTVQYQYDALKRRSKVTDANGSSATFLYDGDGRLTSGSSPGWAAWTFHYNPNGQRDSIANPLGAALTFAFDSNGRITSITDPLKNARTFTYDSLGRVTKYANAAPGEAESYTYDAGGRVTAVSNAMGPLFQYTYDADGHLSSQTDATGRTFTYARDNASQVTAYTTPSGNATTFTYDWRGLRLTRTNPLGEVVSQAYDAMGRVMTVTAPGGLTTTLQRDPAGQMTSLTSANGNTWTMTYDPMERLASVTDPLGNAIRYNYTGTRLAKLDLPLGSVQFSYAANGFRTKAAYSDGTVINKTANALGLVTAADNVAIQRNSLGTPTNMNGIAMTYDAAARPLTLNYAAGKTITYTYDKAGRVSSVADWNSGKTVFTYDAASRRTAVTYPNSIATTYGFDADGRTNSITYGTLGSIALTLDAAGKITSADRNLPIVPTLHDDAKQFTYNSAGQTKSDAYDAMGRVTAQGARTYQWNLASQMTGFSDPVNNATITYDGLGEINTSTASGALQTFVFNHAMYMPSLSIVRQAASDQRYYVYLPNGELLYSIEASTGARHFYHFDEAGNTAFLTDDSGTVTDSYGVTPYGEVVDHAGTFDNPFTYQGQYGVIQEADGLYYMRSRHYDATAARFLSKDPLMTRDPRQSEPYVYAGGNPLSNHDPFGTNIFTDISGAISGAINTIVHYVDPRNWGHPDPQPAPPAPVPPPVPDRSPAPGTDTCSLVSCQTAPDPAQVLQRDLLGLITQDGGGILAEDLSRLISQDGGGLIGQDGAGIIRNDLASLIGQDGAGLLAKEALNLIGQDGAGLISRAALLISNDGGGLLAIDTAALAAAFSTPVSDAQLVNSVALIQSNFEANNNPNFLGGSFYKAVRSETPKPQNNKR